MDRKQNEPGTSNRGPLSALKSPRHRKSAGRGFARLSVSELAQKEQLYMTIREQGTAKYRAWLDEIDRRLELLQQTRDRKRAYAAKLVGAESGGVLTPKVLETLRAVPAELRTSLIREILEVAERAIEGCPAPSRERDSPE